MKRVVGFFLALVCAVANISSAQFVWTKDAANPVFNGSGNGTWDKHVFGSTVLYNSDSARYEMWYIGSYGPEISWHPYRIGFAWSTDGVNWTKYAGNPVLVPDVGRWDEHDVQSAAVLREGSGYKMWYSGIRNGAAKIGLATSVDGIHWTKYAGNPVMTPGLAAWEAGSVGICAIIERSGGYAMWYTGRDASLSEIWRIGRATSIDGITWQKDTLNNPVLSPGSPGQWDDRGILTSSILKVGSTLYLSYTGWRSGYLLRQVGMATSTNEGITWTKHASNPIVSLGAAGSWDASYIEGGAMLLRGETTFHMWYTGSREPTGTYLWRIGHATSPRAGTVRRVPSQYTTIQSAINASVHGDTVLVSDGRYYESINFRGKKIVVASTFVTTGDTSHISNTIIDGSFGGATPDSGSVVYFISGEDTNSVLCGFTITGGKGTVDRATFPPYTPRYGGGVFCRAGARIVHNHIEGNSISHPTDGAGGTGIWCSLTDGAYLIIDNNRINNNTATTAGQSGAGGIGCAAASWKNMTVRIENNQITNNAISSTSPGVQNNTLGGGLLVQYGNFIITKNVINGNTASSLSTRDVNVGGGSHAYGSSVVFRDNIVTNNQVKGPSNISCYAGGVSSWAGGAQRQSVVANNIITLNKAIGGMFGAGGGIMAFDEAARIENNIVVKNTALFGGGVGCARVNLTASEKPAGDGGGAMLGTLAEPMPSLSSPGAVVESPILINNTIAYNNATSGNGGGIATRGGWTPKVINSIVWGDTASTEIYVQSGGIRVLYSNVTNGWPSDSGNIDVNPQLIDSTYKLADISPCIGAGRDSVQIDGLWHHAPSFCFYGTQRPYPTGSLPDIGACENLRGTPTGVDEQSSPLSLHFALLQNYPNPFNPSTNIKYQIPNTSHVTLKVFDILGREVATLVNEVQAAGFKSVTFDASYLASGVYLYNLQAGEFIAAKKLILLR